VDAYLKDPKAIYEASFAIVREQTMLDGLPEALGDVAVRVVHACGMPEIVTDIVASDDFTTSASAALLSGASLLCDCAMVASGITRRFLPADNEVIVTLNNHDVPALAAEMKTTRSAAAVDLWHDHMDGAVLVFGNAPTALFRCLELIAAGGPRPAAIIGCPVGFVGAAESKQALTRHEAAIPHFAIRGTRGGSAMASAVVNALAISCAGTAG